MNLLVVEDDTYKYSKIKTVVAKSIEAPVLNRFDNVCDTVNYLEVDIPDKIVLDMSLPSHKARVREGSPLPLPSGGIEIIYELYDMEYFDVPIFILTQYHEIEIDRVFYSINDSRKKIMDLYEMKNLNVVYYDSDSTCWETLLTDFLRTPV